MRKKKVNLSAVAEPAADPDRFLDLEINMRSIVIIGNGSSKTIDGWFVTPRGYWV